MRFLLLFLIGITAMAAPEPGLVEPKVQADLEGALSRLLPKDQYLLQVNAQVDTVQEKRLVEGETLVQTPETTSVIVPPLPGFKPDPNAGKITPPQQSRQVFKMVDAPVLRSVQVQLTVDERLSEDVANQARDLARKYLSANYGAKGHLSFQRLKLLEPGPGARAGESFVRPGVLSEYLPWALTLVCLVSLCFLWFRQRSSAPAPYRMAHAVEATAVEAKGSLAMAPANGGPATRPLALPAPLHQGKGSYPSLPATAEFVDQRSKLLSVFLAHSEVFRLYFIRLGDAAQSELYAGLRGPAFDSLLEGLGLSIPQSGETGTPPSEEQMLFYEKNFAEFIQANQWQHDQFFGFLQQLTDEQLAALLRNENPLVAAIMLKLMKPAQSAAALEALTSEQRVAILSQSGAISRISTSELLSIEETVRAHVTKLPKFLVGSTKEDLSFWSKVLSQTENQEQILLDLERTRPELYPSLAKFRFRLEDAPSLPRPLLGKVLDEADNQELALALLTCPRDITDFLLNEVNPKRRDLLSSQLVLNEGVPAEKTGPARMALTRRFREVMA